MNWKINNDITRAKVGAVRYEIKPNSFYEGAEPNGYMLARTTLDLNTSGYIGEYEEKIGICCGFGLACAIGLPKQAIRYSIKEMKVLAERDILNIQNWRSAIFVRSIINGDDIETLRILRKGW